MRIDLSKCQSDPERLLGRLLNEVPAQEWPSGWTVEPQAKTKVLEETKDARWVDYDLRVDFLFESAPIEEDPFKPHIRIAVECDSRAYHDLKPEQIERDRWRDRKLAMDGIFVLRYSGKKILNDPDAIRNEIFAALETIEDSLDPLRWFWFADSPGDLLKRCEEAAVERLTRLRQQIESFKKNQK